MATTCKLIAKTTLGSNAATVTLGSGGTIPQTYTDLVVYISARTDGAVVVDSGQISLNSNTANFSGRYLYGTGSSALSATSARFIAQYPGTSATASTFGNTEIYIPNYAGSTNKSLSSTTVVETNATATEMSIIAVLWSDTSAITSITFNPVTGSNFVTGSSFFLYGITKA